MVKQSTDGQLFIVATPIGNLADITLRALDTLKQVDEILCEDTRHSKRLLSHYNISKKLISLHNFNEASKIEHVLDKLKSGFSLALISDAGTPLISDPGYLLVDAARRADLSVVPIPGPSALVTALCASGLPTQNFTFIGFLSATRKKRQSELDALINTEATLIFYESTHRIKETIEDMQTLFGYKRRASLCKELTKAYETFVTGSFSDILDYLTQDERHQKGEFVLIVEGQKNNQPSTESLNTHLHLLLNEGLSTKQAANIAAKLLGCKKNDAYQLALKIKSNA